MESFLTHALVFHPLFVCPDPLGATEQLPLSTVSTIEAIKQRWQTMDPAEVINLKIHARITFLKQDTTKPPW